MNKIIATLCILIVIIATFSVSARPTNLLRQKRQSDQRLAELETLLALQKYGRHRLRPDRKDENRPGYGVVDFNLIGRRKKSTRFLPGGESDAVNSGEGGSNVSQVLSRDFSSWVSKDSESDAPSDPLDNEKIDSLISFPSSLLIEDPQPQRQQHHPKFDITMDKKK